VTETTLTGSVPVAREPRRTGGREGDALLAPNALLNVLALAIVSGVLVGVWVFVDNGGWEYYRTPIGVRGYSPAHRSLRPSGPIGNLLGIVGTLFLLSTLPYVARKKVKWLGQIGSTKGWLEFHVFCGVFGPILITLHTSFRFNGLISVAYWSMVLVVVSGFVGRYLFVRIPKTIRGTELSGAEVERRVQEMKAQLLAAGLPAHLTQRIDAIEAATRSDGIGAPTFGHAIATGIASRKRLAAFRRDVRRCGLNPEVTQQALRLLRERILLLQRLAHLKRTRQLFQLWHVFHRPLVWVMFTILLVHLGVAVYFGYTVFGGR